MPILHGGNTALSGLFWAGYGNNNRAPTELHMAFESLVTKHYARYEGVPAAAYLPTYYQSRKEIAYAL